MIIRFRSYPRAGLVGNPSDGYFGKTIAFAFSNFYAEVLLYQSPELEILPHARDHSRFLSIHDLYRDVRRHGYYGGIRLLKATIKRFYDYCRDNHIQLDNRNFTIRYSTNIPQQVGLAGSSAIITACMRSLMAFYQVSIPKPVLANLILAVENGELKIPAGLQDRVCQVYEGLVYMDFSRELMDRQGYGNYEEIDPRLLPRLYLAYRTEAAEGTEVFHNNIRGRWEQGEQAVVDAMKHWAGMTDQVRDLLRQGHPELIGAVMDASFDLRRTIYTISQSNIQMVDTARAVGASATFTGSGGAIVGTIDGEAMFTALEQRLGAIGVKVFRPDIIKSTGEPLP